MKRSRFVESGGDRELSAVGQSWPDIEASAQQQPLATFKSSIDLVQVSAVVRDRKGRFVRNLAARDFEVLDGGVTRPITDFRDDLPGVSVALLFDVSGSMEAQLATAREAATHVLSWLQDDARRSGDLHVRHAARRGHAVHDGRHAAAAAAAQQDAVRRDVAARRHRADRRATGAARRTPRVPWSCSPTATTPSSRLTPAEVSGIASAIDVPVYIFGIVPSIDNPSAEMSTTTAERSPLGGLAERSCVLDRRPPVRRQHAGRAQQRGATDHRRAAASVSHRV